MSKKTNSLILFSVCVFVATSVFALAKTNTQEDPSNLILHYYDKPQPEAIAPAIAFIDSAHHSGDAHKEWLDLVFFNLIFTQNPKHRPQWQKDINKCQPRIRALLTYAMTTTIDEIFEKSQASPNQNDMYWSAFFITHDEKYLKPIIDRLVLSDNRKDFVLFATGQTAKWSVAANALQYPFVKQLVEKYRDKSTGRSKEILIEVLTKNPKDINMELSQIIKEQKQKGNWTEWTKFPVQPIAISNP